MCCPLHELLREMGYENDHVLPRGNKVALNVSHTHSQQQPGSILDVHLIKKLDIVIRPDLEDDSLHSWLHI